jgi:hypothetical protein
MIVSARLLNCVHRVNFARAGTIQVAHQPQRRPLVEQAPGRADNALFA